MPGPIGIMDLVRQTKQVDIGGGNLLEVGGINAEDVVGLMKRFPDLQALIRGMETSFEAIRDAVPGAINAIIAAGCGLLGNPEAEAKAGLIPIEAQLSVLGAIEKLTFSEGFGPFVLKLRARAAASAQATRPPAMRSPKASSNSSAISEQPTLTH
jgi:hypothetical protein